jgi:hypothetical protein
LNVSEFKIIRGSTFNPTLRWEDSSISYKAITAVTAMAPFRFTCTAHGAPTGWRGAITGIRGPVQLNSANNPPRNSDYHTLMVIDANTVELNAVNAINYPTYVSGG